MDQQQRPMRSYETYSQAGSSSPRSSAWPGIVLAMAMLVLALAGCVPAGGRAATALTVIPAGELEEQYGVRVNLVAVTAAGGLVDVRLKVVDAEKAKQLLKDAASYPVLTVAGSDIILTAPEESRAQGLKPASGELIMLLFPNARNAVKPGTKVAITFGDIQLEPVVAR